MSEVQGFPVELEQVDDFEFCIATESVRRGIPVGLRVVEGDGRQVFSAAGDNAQPQAAARA
jgi:hypothetical protein